MERERINPLRAALSQGRLIRGAFQLFSDPAVSETLVEAGFEFVLVDAEHRALNPETVETLVRAAQGAGGSAMVRVPQLSRGALQYALETGADAVLVPLVNSRAQAEEAVSLSRYPPLGTRGLNANTRPAGWGHPDPAAYARRANAELVVAVQIETPAGLGAVEEIAQVPGLDLIYVGPFDLSHGMGRTGELAHPEVRAAIERIFQAGQARGKWLGVLAPDVDFARWCVERGVRLLTYRSDSRFLKNSAAADFKSIQALQP